MKPDKTESYPKRRVYVRRRSRTTVAQARALGHLDEYLLTSDSIEDAFGRTASVLVEIGFGNGQALAEFAVANPDWNCIGVEVFRPGIGALINECIQRDIENVRIVDGEGLTYLETIPNETVDRIWVLFPDPWPKARHHKRRLVTREFAEVALEKLKNGGKLTIATDWVSYAEDIEKVLGALDSLNGGVLNDASARTTTKYEARGIRLGHSVTEFEYIKQVS